MGKSPEIGKAETGNDFEMYPKDRTRPRRTSARLHFKARPSSIAEPLPRTYAPRPRDFGPCVWCVRST
jgi:hypothetical protein